MDAWVQKIADELASCDSNHGIIVLFQDYRPDLFKSMANQLNYAFYDFRLEEMAPLGMQATKLTIEDLDQALHTLSQSKQAVIHNVEALLGVKQLNSVIHWLERFGTAGWKNNLILPLVILGGEISSDLAGVVDLRDVSFDEQTLISRLIH